MNFVDNVVDPDSRHDARRADVPNPDHLITPGQFGTNPRSRARRNTTALLIPDAAIVTDQSRKLVMTVERGQQGRAQGDPPRAAASPAACGSSAAGSRRTTGS